MGLEMQHKYAEHRAGHIAPRFVSQKDISRGTLPGVCCCCCSMLTRGVNHDDALTISFLKPFFDNWNIHMIFCTPYMSLNAAAYAVHSNQ